jgi:hypothetical protein
VGLAERMPYYYPPVKLLFIDELLYHIFYNFSTAQYEQRKKSPNGINHGAIRGLFFFFAKKLLFRLKTHQNMI